jgi:Tfp pilus assembly protein PilZ
MLKKKNSMPSQYEKRRDERSAYKSPILVEDLNAGFVYRARIVNYSSQGVFIETDVGLQPGDEINIGIENSPFELSSDASKSYRAKVLWQKGLKNGFFNFGYGAIIISSDDDDKPTEEESKELRKHPRKSFPRAVFFTSQNQYHRGFIYDISRGGVFIKTKEIFSVGEIIRLVIPGTKIDKGIMIEAKIVRFSDTGVGVTFVGLITKKKTVGVNISN